MATSVYFLFTLLIAVTTVSSLKNTLPTKVISLHEQCTAHTGYIGECWNINRVSGKPHCGPVACASAVSRGSNHQAYFIGNAPDGLKCGNRKICSGGRCIKLQQGQVMPEQTTTPVDHLYDCYVTGTTSFHRN